MSPATPIPRMSDIVERHVQTILLAVMTAIITAAILFAASYLFTDTKDKGVTQVQVSYLVQQVTEIRADLRNLQADTRLQQGRYVTQDAMSDHEARIRVLEAVKRAGK